MEWEPSSLVILAGVATGLVLGLAARLGRFCIMGGVEDATYGGSLARLRMVSIALATAIAGTTILAALGQVDPGESVYHRLGWSPLAAVLGGLAFGYGMALVGTCGFGALARLGGGDLRSLVMVGVIGVAAYATQAGPLAEMRLWLAPVPPEAPGQTDLGALTEAALGLPRLATGLAIAALFALAGLVGQDWRHNRAGPLWGLAVGLAVSAGWWATSAAAEASFEIVRVESLTFVAPLGDALLFLMTASDWEGIDFTLGSVFGVWLGALIGSAFKREFRWEACDDARELRRQIAGAAMMGVGGVLALGCTIGQGLSAFSMLSLSAPVVLLSILIGARAGLYVLVEGWVPQR